MKEFSIPCKFGEKACSLSFYISEPTGLNPVFFQIWFLTNIRGGTIPQDVLTALNKLLTISRENNVNFEELIAYAFSLSNGNDEDKDETANDNDEDKVKESDSELKFLFADNEYDNFPDFSNIYENEYEKAMEKKRFNSRLFFR